MRVPELFTSGTCVSDGCSHPVAENGAYCAPCWRLVDLHERARVLAMNSSTDLLEATSVCMVGGCEIPDTAAGNVPVGAAFLCAGHWRRVSIDLRHELAVAGPPPRAIERALAAIATSEKRLAGRHPPRPVG